MRFLHKYILLLSVMIIAISVFQFVVFDRLFITKTNTLLLATNERAAQNTGGQLFTYFNKIGDSLKIAASNPKLRANRETLDIVNDLIPEINAIFILNKQGDVVLFSGIESVPSLNFSQRDYFKHAIKGETYIGNVFTSASNREVVAIAVPIIDNGNISGVVVGSVWLHESNLVSMFGNKVFGRNGLVAITDANGVSIYHPDQTQIGKKAALFDCLSASEGSVITANYTGQEQFVGYSKVPELNWFVFVSTPTSEIEQLRNMMIFPILAVSLIGILVVVVIGTFTLRRYMRPFEKLVRAFSSIRKGKYRELPSDEYSNEFGEIIQVYNDTVRKLEDVHTTLIAEADVDGLTGAYNRRSFDKTLALLYEETRLSSMKAVSIMLLDIDNLKQLNDTQGHLVGDDVLRELVAIVSLVAGPRSLFRYGGDEFAVVLRDTPCDRILLLADEIRLKCEKNLQGCTVSIGVATYPQDTKSIDELINFADKALYESKSAKNRVTIYQG